MVGVGLAGCASGGDGVNPGVVMPDVVGQQLDVALSDIERAGVDDEVEVLGGGTFGVVDESNWQVCEQLPGAGQTVTDAPRLTVDRSCPNRTNVSEVTQPEVTQPEVTQPEVTQPEVTQPDAPDTGAATATTSPTTDVTSEQPSEGTEPAQTPHTYEGRPYEYVAYAIVGIGLEEHFVLIDKLDYSTESYKDQIKLIITNVAREQGTSSLIVNVVTDIEIAQLESFPTTEEFYAEHGDDYVNNVVIPKEATDWVASYTGGFDPNTGELSDSDNAFEVIWFIAGENPDIEKWKPNESAESD